MILRAAIAFAVLPHLVHAFEPALPEQARALASEERPRSHYELPIGPFRDGTLPTERLHGLVDLKSWRIDTAADSLTEIGAELRRQLGSNGYDLVFHCLTDDCGGFDFRFHTLVLPPPDMFVDLSDFRFISARRQTEQGVEAVGIYLSRTSTAAMVQVVCVTPIPPVALSVRPAPVSGPRPSTTNPSEQLEQTTDLGDILLSQGHVVLTGLEFKTGSSHLTNGDYPTLKALADWLGNNPTHKVILVGHTDSEGALDKNIELSQNRAASVQAHLVETLGVNADQLDARGIGFLAPISTNASDEGRKANRRVEAVLVSSE